MLEKDYLQRRPRAGRARVAVVSCQPQPTCDDPPLFPQRGARVSGLTSWLCSTAKKKIFLKVSVCSALAAFVASLRISVVKISASLPCPRLRLLTSAPFTVSSCFLCVVPRHRCWKPCHPHSVAWKSKPSDNEIARNFMATAVLQYALNSNLKGLHWWLLRNPAGNVHVETAWWDVTLRMSEYQLCLNGSANYVKMKAESLPCWNSGSETKLRKDGTRVRLSIG